MFGVLNIYKPKGMTSHDVVAVLRRVTKVKQIGHTGTLDPFAEGVLPICIGKATRLIEYFKDDKAYVAAVKLGIATETYDIEGEITKTSDKKISLEEIQNALENFRGDIEQFPPIYSAIKVNGKKLYEYARNGEEVEIKPRKVTINKLDILSFDENEQTLELYIDCSKGTYIRSIANDLGEVLGVGGHLIKLVRVKAGEFAVKDSINLDLLQAKEDVEKCLLKPLDYLDYPIYELNEAEKAKVSNGIKLNIKMSDGLILLTCKNELAAIAFIENNIASMKKVFLP